MIKIFVLLVISSLGSNFLFGQKTVTAKPNDSLMLQKIAMTPERRWGDAGFGFGLDYGGVIGVKAAIYPIPYMGVFVAAGWELIEVGWNVGCLGRLIPADGRHVARPYLKAMYGVNGATKVDGVSGYDKIFYGFTAGAGLELRFGRFRNNGINIDLNVPFRSPEFYEQVNAMKNDPAVDMLNEPLPVAFSIGYHFEF